VLARFVHLEAIPDDPRAWPPAVRGADRLARTLAGARELASLYRVLTRLVTDVPLGESFDDLRWRGLPAGSFDEWVARFDAAALAEAHRRATR
jgi:hypothetical protein